MKKCNPSENSTRKLGQIITKKQNYVDDPTSWNKARMITTDKMMKACDDPGVRPCNLSVIAVSERFRFFLRWAPPTV